MASAAYSTGSNKLQPSPFRDVVLGAACCDPSKTKKRVFFAVHFSLVSGSHQHKIGRQLCCVATRKIPVTHARVMPLPVPPNPTYHYKHDPVSYVQSSWLKVHVLATLVIKQQEIVLSFHVFLETCPLEPCCLAFCVCGILAGLVSVVADD